MEYMKRHRRVIRGVFSTTIVIGAITSAAVADDPRSQGTDSIPGAVLAPSQTQAQAIEVGGRIPDSDEPFPQVGPGGDVEVYDVAPCGGDGIVEVGDVLAILTAYTGSYACMCPGGIGGFWSDNGTSIYNTNTGNVGIGTNSPGSKLHVVDGNFRLQRFGSTPQLGGYRANGTSASPTAVGTDTILLQLAGLGWDGNSYDTEGLMEIAAAEAWTDTAHGSYIRFFTTNIGSLSTPERMRLAPGGSLGLGTTDPLAKLHVVGDQIRLDDYGSPCHILGGRANGTSAAPTALNSGETIAYFGARGYGSTGYSASYTGALNISASQNWTDTAQGTRLRFLATPNGTTTIVEKMRLDHDGELKIYNEVTQETITLDPADSANAAYMTLRMVDGGGVLRDTVSIEAEDGGGGAQILLRNQAGSTRIDIDADGSSDEGFIQVYNGAGQVAVTIDGEDSGGNGRVTTQILEITGGSDLSEQFDIHSGNTTPQPGQVVCIDSTNPGKLVVCTRAYDRTVAGVISGAGGVRPGMIMGQRGSAADGEHPVALTGRVYVLADATDAPIQPGDLLTTSALEGYAKKALDHEMSRGAILGKAMTALSDGQGQVLLLVQPQ